MQGLTEAGDGIDEGYEEISVFKTSLVFVLIAPGLLIEWAIPCDG